MFIKNFKNMYIMMSTITYRAVKRTSNKDVYLRERMVGANSYGTLMNSPWSCSCELRVMTAVFLR